MTKLSSSKFFNVSDFKFNDFESGLAEKKDEFKLPEFEVTKNSGKLIAKNVIKADSDAEKQSMFHLAGLVSKHRGILDLRKQEENEKIDSKVQARLKKLNAEAYEEGIERGKQESFMKSYQEALEVFQQDIDKFGVMVEEFQSQSNDLFIRHKQAAYDIIKNLTKWIVLKEIKDDDKYLERLLEKLVYEINTKNNLIIRINKDNFENMPDIIKNVEEKIGQLKNCRVEVDLDMKETGIILETENVILDGSLESQFESLNKLFGSVDLYE